MEKTNEYSESKTLTEKGFIHIADGVVGIIAGIAAQEVEGITGLEKNSLARIDASEREVVVDLFVFVRFGVPIFRVAVEVQKHVKQVIESMTGLTAVKIDIYIQGVAREPEKEELGGR